MIDKVTKSEDVEMAKFPYPSYTGDIKIKLLNTDCGLGPEIIHIRMEPGSFVPPHLRKKASETLYILDGDVINENKPHFRRVFAH